MLIAERAPGLIDRLKWTLAPFIPDSWLWAEERQIRNTWDQLTPYLPRTLNYTYDMVVDEQVRAAFEVGFVESASHVSERHRVLSAYLHLCQGLEKLKLIGSSSVVEDLTLMELRQHDIHSGFLPYGVYRQADGHYDVSTVFRTFMHTLGQLEANGGVKVLAAGEYSSRPDMEQIGHIQTVRKVSVVSDDNAVTQVAYSTLTGADPDFRGFLTSKVARVAKIEPPRPLYVALARA